MERKGKVIPFRGAEDRKGMGTNLSEGKGKVIQCTDAEGLKTKGTGDSNQSVREKQEGCST